MRDALILDYNGVVVDDEPIHFAVLRDLLAVERIELDRPAYDADYLGFDDRACIREAFGRAGRALDAAALDELAKRKAAWYAETVRAGVPLVPGVREFVRAAADRTRIAVVSGALRREIAAGLRGAGLAGLVTTVVSAEDVSAGKPDPAGLRLALSRLASAAGAEGPWRAAVIEDSRPGLLAARAFGAGCVALTTSHSARDLRDADLVWASFEGHALEELEPLFREVEPRGGA